MNLIAANTFALIRPGMSAVICRLECWWCNFQSDDVQILATNGESDGEIGWNKDHICLAESETIFFWGGWLEIWGRIRITYKTKQLHQAFQVVLWICLPHYIAIWWPFLHQISWHTLALRIAYITTPSLKNRYGEARTLRAKPKSPQDPALVLTKFLRRT